MESSVVREGDGWTTYRGSPSSGLWQPGVNEFSRSSANKREEDDEEALKWAALQKLPTYDRMRTVMLKNISADGGVSHQEFDVRKLSYQDRQQLISKILQQTEEDNERFLRKTRERIDRVGIELPRIEVRFEHLNIEANVSIGSRGLPSLPNFVLGVAEAMLSILPLPSSKRTTLNILSDVSGSIKPGRMTLLLGPPGAGKTTFLLALSGKLDKTLKTTGKVTYNGHEFHEFVPQRTSAYISQRDIQTAEMTVRETLDFSGRCQGVGSRFQMLMELARREKEAGIKPDPEIDMFMKATAFPGEGTSLMTDYVLKILGLEICADTMVGNEMKRGVSGGQKKRLNTGEMLVGPAKALFMDEISSGLDSSTTYQIVKCLRQSVHVLDGTMIVSLLQPAPETYALFDDLILLSEGVIVYQGPCDLVLEFFESMGFRCPPRKGTADFLQEVTSRKDQGQYWYNKSIPYQYVPVKAFADAFQRFHVGERLHQELTIPFDRTKCHPAALVTKKYALSNWEIFQASYAREKLLMKRNAFVYIFKTVQISIVALITMSVFLRTKLHPDSVNSGILYIGAMFFGLINVLFNGFTDMALTVMRLPVFYKQRDMFLYPAWAFVLPSYFLRLPLSIFETFTWMILTYWTIGFAPEASRFFRQWLVLFAMHQLSLGLFRLVSAVGRILVLTQSFGACCIVILLALGGFIVSRANIPPWWIWGYWLSPFTYALNALSVNEFLAPRWNKPGEADDGLTLGREILLERGMFDRGYWYWLGVGVLIAYSILFNFLYCFFLIYLNPLDKPKAVLSQEAFDEKMRNKIGDAGNVKNGSLTTSSGSNPQIPQQSIELNSCSSVSQRSSISSAGGNSDRSDAVAEADVVLPKKGMVLPFQPLSIAFHHINYFIDMPPGMKAQGVTEDKLQLLNDISGSFRPGVLTALVGVSGAGKTTFMDVLAGRKTGGYIEGSIYISGYPKKQETFARVSGYCEQFDIHSPNVTVHESLLYSAWLRLSKDVSREVRRAFVEEVMELVELTPLRLALVGLPGVSGLSTEQRKRLTVAVELVANPSIIFMDEPTSGLDARAAAIVMRTVRNTVDTGRTVVCTIHQPSIDIFEAFDELLLMQRGGRVLYAGPLGHHSQKLIDYFEAVEGVPRIKDGINPSTWMLEVTSQASEQKLDVNFADIYTKSALYQRNEDLINQLSSPAPGVQDISFPTEYAQPFWQQCLACLWKQQRSYWRNPYYNVIRIFLAVLYGCFYGTICLGFGHHRSTEQDVFNMMGALYASTLFLGASNALAVQPVVSVERTVFYRERAAGMYSTFPYSFGQVTVELPYVFAQAVLFGTILYALIQFEWMAAKFLLFIFFLYFTLLIFTLWGMLTVALTPNPQVAAIVSAAAFGIWNLFAGFLIPRPSLPIYWVWYYWLSPTAWTLYGLVASQLGDVTSLITVKGTYGTHVQATNETRLPIREFLDTHFGFHHSFLPYVAIWHVGIVLVFGLVFAISIKWINFQRR